MILPNFQMITKFYNGWALWMKLSIKLIKEPHCLLIFRRQEISIRRLSRNISNSLGVPILIMMSFRL